MNGSDQAWKSAYAAYLREKRTRAAKNKKKQIKRNRSKTRRRMEIKP